MTGVSSYLQEEKIGRGKRKTVTTQSKTKWSRPNNYNNRDVSVDGYAAKPFFHETIRWSTFLYLSDKFYEIRRYLNTSMSKNTESDENDQIRYKIYLQLSLVPPPLRPPRLHGCQEEPESLVLPPRLSKSSSSPSHWSCITGVKPRFFQWLNSYLLSC